MKNIKFTRRDFHSVTPRGGTWGTFGGWVVQKIFSEIQPDLVCELLT